jgi:hypothetical protein
LGDDPRYEWKHKRGWFNRTAEKLEELPANLVSRKGALTRSRKRAIYEKGRRGKATILKAPPESMMRPDYGGQGPYMLRVELPGGEPYEVRTWQDVTGWEWKRLTPGTLVDVWVDPDDDERLVLALPEGGKTLGRVMDSAEILAQGHRATATIQASQPFGRTAPGTDDPVYVLELELRSEAEAGPWPVRIGQRVPRGAEEMVAPGSELTVAYLEVDEGDSVAVDWQRSTGGRFR